MTRGLAQVRAQQLPVLSGGDQLQVAEGRRPHQPPQYRVWHLHGGPQPAEVHQGAPPFHPLLLSHTQSCTLHLCMCTQVCGVTSNVRHTMQSQYSTEVGVTAHIVQSAKHLDTAQFLVIPIQAQGNRSAVSNCNLAHVFSQLLQSPPDLNQPPSSSPRLRSPLYCSLMRGS